MHCTWIAMSVACSASLLAQVPERSASRDILDRARAALNDVRYARADSIARDLLSLGGLQRAARVEALQIIAAANFPDSPSDRRDMAARSAITQLLQIDLAHNIPRELANPGLDSLYQSVLSSTYATSVIVRRENPIVGIDGTAALRVRASRPSIFTLAVRSRDGIERFLIDSVAGVSDTTLAIRVARNGRVLFSGGEYDLIVTGTEISTRQSHVKSFDAVVIVPPLELVAIPAAVDSLQLKPERAIPDRQAGIVAGLLAGAATIAIGKSLRASDPIRAAGESDSRYTAAGVVMALGAIAAAWFDRGRVLDKGIDANRRIQAEHVSSLRAAREENVRRATAYRASVTINPEAR